MGNFKFKLTNMIPNSWFYKLKAINTTSKTLNLHNLPPLAPPPSPPTTTLQTQSQSEPKCPSRKSYHITRELTYELPKELDHSILFPKSPPRKSNSTTKLKTSSTKTNPEETNVGLFVEDAMLKIKAKRVHNKQNILNHALTTNESEHVNENFLQTNNNIKLSPIITKEKSKPKKMTIVSPRGVRLNSNSPRIIGRKQGQNRNTNRGTKVMSSKKSKSILESFAVVKSSFDPQRDFKESMVEMILQNNLTDVRDLEDLLACYLSLNSNEYHEVIIKVFKQIWIDLRHRI